MTQPSEYTLFCDDVYRCCKRDFGYTPGEWLVQNTVTSSDRAALSAHIRHILKVSFEQRVTPDTAVSRLVDQVFDENPHTQEIEQ